MEIRLTNFRCHETKTVKLNPGVSLIVGESGCGKTTVLEAIDYALYGKMQKVASHGQKKCTVELILSNEIKILRLGSKRLTLTYKNQQYEDAAGQGIIDELFGDYENFSAACYMKQGERCPLMTGSNADKMSLIRAISFKDSKALEIQTTLKESLKKGQANVAGLQSGVTSTTAVLSSFDQQHPDVKATMTAQADRLETLLTTGLSSLDSHAEEIIAKVKQIREDQVLIFQKEEKLKTLRQIRYDEVDVNNLEAEIAKIDEEVAENAKKLEEISILRAQKAAAEQLLANQKKLQETRKQLVEARQKREDAKKVKEEALKRLQDEFDQIETFLKTATQTQQITEASVNAEIERIQKSKQHQFGIEMILSRCKVSAIEELRAKSADMARRIREVKGTITGISASVENRKWNEQQQKVLLCPKCSTGLKLEITGNSTGQVTTSSHKLHIAEGFVSQIRTVEIPEATEDMLKTKEREMNDIENEKETYLKALSEIAQLQINPATTTKDDDVEKLAKCNKWKELFPRLTREKQEVATFDLGTEVPPEDPQTTENSVLQTFPADVELSSRENEIRTKTKKLVDKKMTKARILDKKDEKDRHAKMLVEAEEDLKKILLEKGENLQKVIDESMAEHKETIQLKEICVLYQRRKELAKKVQGAEELVKVEDQKVQNLTKLYEISKRVEREVLENTVALINMQMERFLNVLFAVDPIKVQFKTTKDLKSKKAKSMTCSIAIFYKNVVYDDPKQLSGGELDRISLAMMLALNALSNSMFLLLDESLSALNSALKANVVGLLRETCGLEKTCMVIEHEGTEGVYDHVMSLAKGE
jgi:DNA repair protein SbcC/Rad50